MLTSNLYVRTVLELYRIVLELQELLQLFSNSRTVQELHFFLELAPVPLTQKIKGKS